MNYTLGQKVRIISGPHSGIVGSIKDITEKYAKSYFELGVYVLFNDRTIFCFESEIEPFFKIGMSVKSRWRDCLGKGKIIRHIGGCVWDVEFINNKSMIGEFWLDECEYEYEKPGLIQIKMDE